MTVTTPDELLQQIVLATEHYVAYLQATLRDPRPFEQIAQRLQSKSSKVAVMPPSKKTSGLRFPADSFNSKSCNLVHPLVRTQAYEQNLPTLSKKARYPGGMRVRHGIPPAADPTV